MSDILGSLFVVRCSLPVGHSAGLAYLARHLAAMSMMRNSEGLHVHLDADLGQLDPGSHLLTIRNLDFERNLPGPSNV